MGPRNESFLGGRDHLSRWVSEGLLCVVFWALAVLKQGLLVQDEKAGSGSCCMSVWISQWKESFRDHLV